MNTSHGWVKLYRCLGQQQCAIHAQRGGVWEIFTGTTHLAMMQRRSKLCGTKPLNLNALRNRYKKIP